MSRKRTPKSMWAPPAEKAIQFKVALRYIRPPIWRRVVLPDNLTLADLHGVIQVSMGWCNCHMHAFRIGGVEYTSASACAMDDLDELEMQNEDTVLLRQVVKRARQNFSYEYDFGDSWVHEITVEKMLPIEPDTVYPLCLAGKRACPPEDCGSFPGYADILEALAVDKKTVEQQELLEWAGEYDPERFDLESVNKRLTGKHG